RVGGEAEDLAGKALRVEHLDDDVGAASIPVEVGAALIGLARQERDRVSLDAVRDAGLAAGERARDRGLARRDQRRRLGREVVDLHDLVERVAVAVQVVTTLARFRRAERDEVPARNEVVDRLTTLDLLRRTARPIDPEDAVERVAVTVQAAGDAL